MRVIISQSLPFSLAHGGTQTFVEAMMRELSSLGVTVEPERWWDEEQTADLIHFVNRPSLLHVQLAQKKGLKTVMTEFLDQPSSRTPTQLLLQRAMIRLGRKAFSGFTGRLGWDIYHELDAMIYAARHELETAEYLFSANPSRGHVIPHGLESSALDRLRQPAAEKDYLISVATIAERKNTVLLAMCAKEAAVPVLFVGKPYAGDDAYFRKFQSLIDDKHVRYAGFVEEGEKARLLRESRGFALLSQFESGCIAIYEAAAAGLPLFLPDLPWATRGYPRAQASRFASLKHRDQIVSHLRLFYEGAHRLNGPTFPVTTWNEVATQYLAIYKRVLKIQ